jgi:hypothetical protein
MTPVGTVPELMKIELEKLTKAPEAIPLMNKKGEPKTPEEIFMLRHIPPATESQHVKNTYELNVNVQLEACTCCSPKPSISVPMTIIPLADPAIYGFPEPPGFAPVDLGMF